MNAYKKSGKANRFFEDDDDDFDIHALNSFDDEDIEQDEDDFLDEEED
jgi:hypothetical protein